MAGGLSLSNLLCFLVNKYGKLKSIDLKVVLSEFYSIEDIAEAKFLLLNDLKNAVDTSTFDKLPHVARRRDSVNRLGKEVLDDLFSLWVFVDSHVVSASPMHQFPSASYSWALGGSESTSTPTGQSGTTTVDVHSDQYAGCSESNDELPFTVVESARSRRKRRRQQNSPPQQQLRQQQQQQQQPQTNDKKDGNTKRPGRSLIIGKSIAARNDKPLSKEIKAANEFYKKAVFYIDNVDPSVTAEDLEEFLTTKLSVQVFSVFDAKPRKYKNNTNKSKKNTEIVVGNAFRLCINNEHRDRLLNEDCWPAYVKVATKQQRNSKTNSHQMFS